MLKKIIITNLIFIFAVNSFSHGAEESGGMPQLNPEFWVSQIFWLILSFGILFIILSKTILPKISVNLESRKSQILENVEMADKQRKISEEKNKHKETKLQQEKALCNQWGTTSSNGITCLRICVADKDY